MASLTELKQQLAEAETDLQAMEEILELDPESEEGLTMKHDLEISVAGLKAQIAAQQNQRPPPPPPPVANASAEPSKIDMSKHPKFLKPDAAPPPPPPDPARIAFDTGDTVMAKWSEDRQWYAATIISKTGSNADPVYTVNFTSYGNKETKRAHEVRAAEGKKRKAEGAPAAAAAPIAPTPRPASNGAVISAAPSIDLSLVQKREPSKVSDGPTRAAPAPKKLKGSKALDKAKNNWNDWQKGGPKKAGGMSSLQKESQFRTNDSVNARVGFTNSGKPMQKDQARKTWVYDRTTEQADDD